MSPARLVLVAALAIACHGALAQTVVPPAVTVQRTAPQLVGFAGSQSNFQNLVNGLAQGAQVQLVTVLPDGFTQIVTFTPTAAMPPVQIAQVLETARQQLIGIGIANPTAEQIAVTLMGGVVPTPLGGSQVAGVINPQNPQNPQNPPSPAAQVQGNAALGATTSTTPTPATPSTVIPPVNVQIFPGSTTSTATTAAQPRATSDSLNAPGSTSRSPVPATPTAPGAAATTTPQSPMTGAPAAAPATTTPAPVPGAAQPGNTNSGFSTRR